MMGAWTLYHMIIFAPELEEKRQRHLKTRLLTTARAQATFPSLLVPLPSIRCRRPRLLSSALTMVKTYHPGSSAPPPRLSHSSSSSSSYQTQYQQAPPLSQPDQPQQASHPTHAGKGPISVPPPANLPTSGRHRVVLDRTLIELLVGGGGVGEKRAYDGDGQESREFVGLKCKCSLYGSFG
jgi:hypothetical protein